MHPPDALSNYLKLPDDRKLGDSDIFGGLGVLDFGKRNGELQSRQPPKERCCHHQPQSRMPKQSHPQSAISSSTRARCSPMQRCSPKPKPSACPRPRARCMSKRSGPGNTSASRSAARVAATMPSPARIVCARRGHGPARPARCRPPRRGASPAPSRCGSGTARRRTRARQPPPPPRPRARTSASMSTVAALPATSSRNASCTASARSTWPGTSCAHPSARGRPRTCPATSRLIRSSCGDGVGARRAQRADRRLDARAQRVDVRAAEHGRDHAPGAGAVPLLHVLRRIHVDKRRPVVRGRLAARAQLGEAGPRAFLCARVRCLRGAGAGGAPWTGARRWARCTRRRARRRATGGCRPTARRAQLRILGRRPGAQRGTWGLRRVSRGRSAGRAQLQVAIAIFECAGWMRNWSAKRIFAGNPWIYNRGRTRTVLVEHCACNVASAQCIDTRLGRKKRRGVARGRPEMATAGRDGGCGPKWRLRAEMAERMRLNAA